jgi:hypothetical protein
MQLLLVLIDCIEAENNNTTLVAISDASVLGKNEIDQYFKISLEGGN